MAEAQLSDHEIYMRYFIPLLVEETRFVEAMNVAPSAYQLPEHIVPGLTQLYGLPVVRGEKLALIFYVKEGT